MYDLVIRGGRIIDGSGMSSINGDIGVKDGRIARIGRIIDKGAREIDAQGCIVTPGFIDGHTHYDAQVNWDPLLTPSSWHGVTSVVMGNCGFTIAPVRKGREDAAVSNLERAEDISAEAMAQGIKWNWETFPEYLDNLDTIPKALNCAANIGHSALRSWAMGDRALEEEATPEDLELMRGQVREAIRAGAIGFTSSRGINHLRADNRPVASRVAAWSEIESLVGVLGEEGLGIFEIAREKAHDNESITQLATLSRTSGVPITFGLTLTNLSYEGAIPALLSMADTAAAEGGSMFFQTHSKGVSVLLSFETQLPFDGLPVWKEFRTKSLAEQEALLRDPKVRAELVAAADNAVYGKAIGGEARPPEWDRIYVYDKELPPYATMEELSKARNQNPVDLMIELCLEKGLKAFFIQFLHPDAPDTAIEIMKHPRAIMTFSDSGAHVSQISDSNIQTHLLAYWVRERKVFTLEEAIQMITLAPARAWGLADRGLIREGMAADLNVIDFERLLPLMPEVVDDIPGGARRIIQRCAGIKATVVNGEVILEEGVPTGANPGKVHRAGQMTVAV